MSKMKHTPGPWVANENGCVCEVKKTPHGSTSFIKIVSPWVEDAWYGDDEALANARLIAAAPELLGGVKSILGAFAIYTVEDDSRIFFKVGDSVQTAEQESPIGAAWLKIEAEASYLRTIIAKATGAPQ